MRFSANKKVMKDRIIISSVLYDKTTEIGNCKVIVTDNKWTISGWYVNKSYQNKGFGNHLLKETFQYIINNKYVPNTIDYIWNGTNQYVYNWIVDKFDAYCDCPIAVRKNSFDDDWNSHIYHLNKNKLFEYFELKKGD